MPDYNPAVAAGIQPPQSNLLPTLEGIAQLQIGQAHAGLYSLQALQYQRNQSSLANVNNLVNQGVTDGNTLSRAWLAGGGDVEKADLIAKYGGTLNELKRGGGVGAQATAEYARAGEEAAQTRNINAALSGVYAENEIKFNAALESRNKVLAQRATDLYNNPSPENAKDMLNDHSMHMSDLNRNRLALAAQNGDTAAIRGMAVDMQTAVMSPEERAKFVQPGTPAQPAQPAQVAGPTQPARPPIPAQPTTLLSAPQAVAKQKAAETQAAVPAELDKELQDRAQGSIEAIQRLQRLRAAVNSANPANFGSIIGGEKAREYQPVPALAAEHDNLKALYTDAGSAMLKSRYGARVTNMDVTQGMKIVGGTTVQNKATALKIIDNNMAEAYDTIANGIKRGVVDPQILSQILSRPRSKAEADALGPGALWLTSAGDVKRNPK